MRYSLIIEDKTDSRLGGFLNSRVFFRDNAEFSLLTRISRHHTGSDASQEAIELQKSMVRLVVA
uniref:DNA-binding response regulator n=1 Tax=Ascaris lumbricoides TaxID=6252 RepID=A0A0M3I4N7_ASCLU